MSTIPPTCDIAIIGGGPAGSSVAALLAREGFDVVLLERARHPRPMVGESLIPHFWKYTDLTGATPAIKAEGFIAKAGGITVWDGEIHRIRFADFGFERPALHVERDVFDLLLLRHARRCGARVFEQVSVTEVIPGDQARLTWVRRGDGETARGTLRCRYLVDASGASSLVARRLGRRHLARSPHQFLSFWGYFTGSRFIDGEGRARDAEELARVRPVTFVCAYEDGWIWHIPLRRLTSVGLVIYCDRVRGLEGEARQRYFLDTCARVPYLRDLLAPARFVEGSLSGRPDFSYHVERVAEDNLYCIGDAGGFVDPIFSHGVLNAFYGAVLAALAIRESLHDPARRQRHAQLCAHRLHQFYSFSRALALGDIGVNGVDFELVKRFMRSVPERELELMLAVSHITHRTRHFRRLIEASGLAELGRRLEDRARLLECLSM
ncbi:MAG TPA: NAD(P)/FAD-dependent oxidoreductase [Methylothermaceae bacterium]|nr:NAD(P)/FAD-dependent oxidoreductase [Methylothermaceae bacterium]